MLYNKKEKMCYVCNLNKPWIANINIILIWIDDASVFYFLYRFLFYGGFLYTLIQTIKPHIFVFGLYLTCKLLALKAVGYVTRTGETPEAYDTHPLINFVLYINNNDVCKKIEKDGIKILFFRTIILDHIKASKISFPNAINLTIRFSDIDYIKVGKETEYLDLIKSKTCLIEGEENLEKIWIAFSSIGKITNCSNLSNFKIKDVSIVDFNCEYEVENIENFLRKCRNLIRYNNFQNEKMKEREKAGHKIKRFVSIRKYKKWFRDVIYPLYFSYDFPGYLKDKNKLYSLIIKNN